MCKVMDIVKQIRPKYMWNGGKQFANEVGQQK